MSSQPLIDFRFSGGLADQGQMDFYHAARFDYGAARLLLKLQYFIDEGVVLQRTSRKVQADFRIQYDEQGSWLRRVLDYTAEKAESSVFDVPVSMLMAMLNNKISKRATIGEIAEQIEGMQAQTDMEKNYKSQLQGYASSIDTKIYSEQRKYFQEFQDKIQNSDLKGSVFHEEVKQQVDLFDSIIGTDKVINENWGKVSGIDEADLDALLILNKGAVEDMVYPIRNGSVDGLSAENDNQNIKAVFNNRNADAFFGEKRDHYLTEYSGRIKNLDFENGWGKFRSEEFISPISFQIPKESMKRDLTVLSEAANKGTATISVYNIRDKQGNVLRLIYESLVDY